MKLLLINPPAFNTIESEVPEVVREERGYNPPLGILSIAGYLEKKSEIEIEILDTQVEELNIKQIEERIKFAKPNAVGITTMTFTLLDVLDLAKLVKKINPEIKVILGGPHPHIFPQETINFPEVDFLVIGEGEETNKELMENITDKDKLRQVRGIVFKDNNEIINTGSRPLIMNLDDLPFPARHLTPYKKYTSVLSSENIVTTAFTSRGCPYKCLFCDRPHLGKFFRARSAKNVAAELELCQKMGIGEVLIYDDTFTIDRARVIDICNEILQREIKIGWDIRARVDTVDEEVLKKLKEAGCLRIHYGIEAGTEKILKVLRKGITLEMAERAIKMTKKVGIQTLAYFMIGSPTETKEDIEQTIAFAKKIDPDFVHITILTPFPATDVYRLGLEKGVIPYDYWQKFAKNPTKEFSPLYWEESLKKEELKAYLGKAYKSFYFRPHYLLKRVLELRSWDEFKRKSQAGLSILKFKK
jgi:radical SAM superfamily enzyme YgiQ (UPF0313 family)